MNQKRLNDIAIVIAVLVVLALFIALIFNIVFKIHGVSPNIAEFLKTKQNESIESELKEDMQESETETPFNSLGNSDDVSIKLNVLMEFNGKTKDRIMDIRKYYLNNSAANNDVLQGVVDFRNYEPNENIFGKIADNKPWIGIKAASCNWAESIADEKTQGDSEESVFINNPLALVMVEMSYYTLSLPEVCDENAYLLPVSLKYSKSKRTFTLTYNISKYQNVLVPENRKTGVYSLKAINAVDMGYNWAYAYDSPEIHFYRGNGVDVNPYQFRDFIHVGSACGVKGGCNNGSPYQPEIEFAFRNLPAHLRLKLWKEQPKKSSSSADVYFDIVFE